MIFLPVEQEFSTENTRYLQTRQAEIDPAWVKEQLLWRDTCQYVIAQGSVINAAVIPPASLALSLSLSVIGCGLI